MCAFSVAGLPAYDRQHSQDRTVDVIRVPRAPCSGLLHDINSTIDTSHLPKLTARAGKLARETIRFLTNQPTHQPTNQPTTPAASNPNVKVVLFHKGSKAFPKRRCGGGGVKTRPAEELLGSLTFKKREKNAAPLPAAAWA